MASVEVSNGGNAQIRDMCGVPFLVTVAVFMLDGANLTITIHYMPS